jgi:hypothetical protein
MPKRKLNCRCQCTCGSVVKNVNFVDICVDNYVACKPMYRADVTKADQQDFWLGKVLKKDAEDKTLQVCWWNTKYIVMRNLTRTCSYVPWLGEEEIGWIEAAKVIHMIPVLLKSGKISSPDMRIIQKWVANQQQHGIDETPSRKSNKTFARTPRTPSSKPPNTPTTTKETMPMRTPS